MVSYNKSSSTDAGELLAEYGSLTGLARASLANLRRRSTVAALRLGTLACKDTLTQEHVILLNTPLRTAIMPLCQIRAKFDAKEFAK